MCIILLFAKVNTQKNDLLRVGLVIMLVHEWSKLLNLKEINDQQGETLFDWMIKW